mmetsp:Transcript_39398/g.47790  ORF Transcript_39398/g.47790 Transcript_39398/m.47790 type:complete len:127 (-) Transcript_39398:62-442(-)
MEEANGILHTSKYTALCVQKQTHARQTKGSLSAGRAALIAPQGTGQSSGHREWKIARHINLISHVGVGHWAVRLHRVRLVGLVIFLAIVLMLIIKELRAILCRYHHSDIDYCGDWHLCSYLYKTCS